MRVRHPQTLGSWELNPDAACKPRKLREAETFLFCSSWIMDNFAILQLRFINLESDNHNFQLSVITVILPGLSEWCECSTKAQSIAGFLGPNCCSVHPKVHGGCTEAVVTMENCREGGAGIGITKIIQSDTYEEMYRLDISNLIIYIIYKCIKRSGH